ncbi:MAG: gamma-glutamyl-gamma-aminobutyrate hydrolase family protein [Pseudomonadota bacterium]
MRIAITMRRINDPRYGEVRDAISRDWYDYLNTLCDNIVFLPVPNQPGSVRAWLSALSIEGVILSNGNDWGESNDRDKTERVLVEWCRETSTPIFGVCRGLQALNTMFGGSIHTNISSLTPHAHEGTIHSVSIVDQNFSKFAGTDSLFVNSYHNQGVTYANLANDFVPFVLDGTEVVEAFYHRNEPILAVQWHPERANPSREFDAALIQRVLSEGAFWRKGELG